MSWGATPDICLQQHLPAVLRDRGPVFSFFVLVAFRSILIHGSFWRFTLLFNSSLASGWKSWSISGWLSQSSGQKYKSTTVCMIYQVSPRGAHQEVEPASSSQDLSQLGWCVRLS